MKNFRGTKLEFLNIMKKEMQKYKVEFIETSIYIVDVLAKDEKEAKEKAQEKFYSEIKAQGLEHNYQVGDTDSQTGTVYDVTNTDDPFNP